MELQVHFALEEEASKERDEVELPGYEQANHFKGQGKDKLLGGAMKCHFHT